MAAACLDCHREIADDMESKAGLHGVSSASDMRQCGSCHTEHAGTAIPLVANASFHRAGVNAVDSYDHRHVEAFDLHGRHVSLACRECHLHADAAHLAPGQKRYLGLTTTCTSCHADAHDPSFGADCATCHGQAEPFTPAAHFAHTTDFPLDGGHRPPPCTRCHEASGAHSVLALRQTPAPTRDCVDCHADPHQGSMGTSCGQCHGTALPFDRADRFGHPDRFPLDGRHANRACAECHAPTGPTSVSWEAEDPQPTRHCADCHDSPHDAAFLARVGIAGEGVTTDVCLLCHAPTDPDFRQPHSAMTGALHECTGFPLTPPHAEAVCADCHKPQVIARADDGAPRGRSGPDRPARREPGAAEADLSSFALRFPGRAADDCAACHADVHSGQLTTGPTGGRCTECHAATHFMPPAFALEHHGRSRFPLTGAHRAVSCSACHPRDDGGATRFVPTPTSCALCHTDVHNGAFDTQLPAPGGTDCAACHAQTRFDAVTWTGADHLRWTGYALRGAHSSASCRDCHGRLTVPGAQGRTLGRASSSCASCHSDPHGGQFARASATDCARCHTESASFATTTFDHQRDSRFALDLTHRVLDCSACHRPEPGPGGASVVRYVPLGTSCADCHRPTSRPEGEVP